MKKISSKLNKQLYDEAFDKAEKFQKNKQYENAILAYKEAINIAPESYLAYNNMAIAYANTNDLKNCEKALRKAYKIYPENKTTCINLASCLYMQKKYNNAVKYYKKGISGRNYDNRLLKVFCDALYRTGKYLDAAKYIENYSIMDANTELYIRIVDKLIEQEKFTAAKKILKKISLSDKNSITAYNQSTLIKLGIDYNKKYKVKNKKTINSLSEFIEEINEIKNSSPEGIFIYRGQKNKYLPLIPSLYRNKSLIVNEKNIIQDFNLKAEAFFNRDMELFDNIDKIALMQHHGVPTRLLDFSESPLVALYFALENITEDTNDAPCVYAINLKAFDHNTDGYLLSSKQIKAKTEDDIFKYKTGTCAFSPKLKNKRLTAQKGVFVLFNENTALEKCIQDEYITKIEISNTNILKICKELNNIGITPSTVYPDFMGLANEVKTPRKFVSSDKDNLTLSSVDFSKIYNNIFKNFMK